MASKVTPLEKILNCIDNNENFVLQGGAGSGKTETLSQLISALTLRRPNIRVACITHTNKAAEEISLRATGEHSISTIHSFINRLIADYQKNIHSVISKIFEVDSIVLSSDCDSPDKKEWAKKEHERYKKAFEKFSATSYIIRKLNPGKAAGKVEYDKNRQGCNDILNTQIDELNNEIRNLVKGKNYQLIAYNETRFNNFSELTYSHDDLLSIAAMLFSKFPLLGKVLTDKYDCIFVDEYQDTDEKIVNLFLNLRKDSKTIIGFFGDSMQAIYDSGVGSLQKFIDDKKLIKIEKEDNYRCSQQVIDFINTLRDDGLIQEVALKTINGYQEALADRQGDVEIFYSVIDEKPNLNSPIEVKVAYASKLDYVVGKASSGFESKTLLLTNSAVSGKANFSALYKIFSNYYLEPKEKIDRTLKRLQLFDLFELCQEFQLKNYNSVLTKLKKVGLSIRRASDKKKIHEAISAIIDSNQSAIETVEKAFELKLLKRSEGYNEYVNRLKISLSDFEQDEKFKEFEAQYKKDGHTLPKMRKLNPEIDEDYFDEQKRNIEKRDFYSDLLSNKFTFADVLNYYKYEDEQTPFITMHKTKGTGIDNVLVVLEEFYWNKYDFASIFDDEELDIAKRGKNLKLFYVACSRAKQNLRCVRIVSSKEKPKFLNRFKNFKVTEIKIPSSN